jgi:hypothetical protein
MATPELLEFVKNIIIDDQPEFSSGYYNGYLYYYDTNTQLPQPLTCQAILQFFKENLADPSASEAWNLGFLCGWMVALNENNPDHVFTSVLVEEPDLVLLKQPA